MKTLEIKWESQHGISSKNIEHYLINDHPRRSNIEIKQNFGSKIIIKTNNSEKGLEKELERVFGIIFWIRIL